ncbi:unnamed protein product [Staurois parvus]|uniref:Uncharacterized protein n=1 Tax=Staurois parvus TaxID=386267 RepID=A0ABN9GZ94_9NEOB|nr:unnamed protein product [Staurois parvus]
MASPPPACPCSLVARSTAIRRPRSGARCVLQTQANTDRQTGPLCEVPIM